MTSQMEMIKAQVLNRLANAVEFLVQGIFAEGSEWKGFATCGMLLQVEFPSLKRFGQLLCDGDRREARVYQARRQAEARGEGGLHRRQTRITRAVWSIFQTSCVSRAKSHWLEGNSGVLPGRR